MWSLLCRRAVLAQSHKWITATVFQRSVCARIKLQRPQEIKQKQAPRHKPESDVSFWFTQELFTEQDTNIDEHSVSVHSRSGTMFSDFTPTMDSSGTWDSTCSSWRSSWRSRCCSGRASHPMRVKSDCSVGTKSNIVGLGVTACKHIDRMANMCVTHRSASSQATSELLGD
jgi:hypothetical protein